jgi:type I restriction enzyme S subunit
MVYQGRRSIWLEFFSAVDGIGNSGSQGMKPGWKSATLGEAFITSTGSTPPKSNSGFYGQFMPLVKPPELLDSTLDSAEDGLSEAGAQVARTLPANSILVSCIGNLGKIGMNTVPVACNQQINAIHPAPGKALPEFMFYQTLGGRFREQLEALASGTTVPIVNKSKFNSIEIVLPPLPEQQRIVTLLDEAFDGMATAKAHAEKNLQNARELFESHIYGVNAKAVPLGEMVKITTGKLDANAAVDGGQYPFFTCSREVYAINHHAFDTEAILLAGNNAVGDFNVKHYKGKFNAYQRTYVITVNEPARVLYRFLYFQMLKSLKKFKDQSVGAGTKFLKIGMIKDLEITLPSLAEQAEIVATVDSLRDEAENLVEIYERKLAALDELKKSLLQQAFNGEL